MFVKHGMNSGFSSLASSAVLRRQQFLIRSLKGYSVSDKIRMEAVKCLSGGASLEANAESVLRAITPSLDPTRHKGQAGKIAVIGGCREYTGAPYFAAISALKIGADLSHVFCTEGAATVIKSYSPELIVHPILEESYNISGVNDEGKRDISKKILSEFDKWMERFDCLVVGPGLGRDPFLLECVSKIMTRARQSNVPIVVDGDGLFLVTNSIELVSGYRLAVLTPNVNEYKRLVQKVLGCDVNDQNSHGELLSLSKQYIPFARSKPFFFLAGESLGDFQLLFKQTGILFKQTGMLMDLSYSFRTVEIHSAYCFYPTHWIGNVTILRKGKSDLISDGEKVQSVSIYGSPRRCGGQGDILSGSVAVFLSWARQCNSAAERESTISRTNPTVLGCIAGSALLRKAAALAFEHKKRSTLTTDIIEHLGQRYTHLS
ncbi:hypothetical protein Gogos_011340 [Gossypium gossypioides]|uniref:ATP-dependent (S)-NAD(P)H-hydrate dehydratase n=1 Tax=Gossypium gossypioides TaxID=34282 RepID=A0A7J9BP42_GOSGO|nr:hypothetical protein [Gossypium gossypioides]